MSQVVEERVNRGSREQNLKAAPSLRTRPPSTRNLSDLVSSDYFARMQSADWAGSQGVETAEELVRILTRISDVSKFPVVGQVLEAMGTTARPPVLRAIRGIDIKRPRDVYLAECLLDTLPEGRDRETAEVLASVVDRCRAVIRSAPPDDPMVDLCQHARIKAHEILGWMEDRSRLDDLIALSRSNGPHLRPEIIDTFYEIGDARAIQPLLRSYEAQSSPALQEDIRDAIHQILKREQLVLDTPALSKLTQTQRATLERLWPRARNGNGTRP